MKNKKPSTFFIGCCDNRIIPHCLTSKTHGDLFVLRNIGNLIPPYKASATSVAAAIEYAVEILAIPEIIVCGHSDCGGMKSILAGVKDNSCLGRWVKYAVPANNITLPDELARANVLHQIKNLMTYPAVVKGLSEGVLIIHGWWFDLDADILHGYDKKTKEWKSIS
jgi:carbonic anhydrase